MADHEEPVTLERHICCRTGRGNRAICEVGGRALNLHARSYLDWVAVSRRSLHLRKNIAETERLICVTVSVEVRQVVANHVQRRRTRLQAGKWNGKGCHLPTSCECHICSWGRSREAAIQVHERRR